MCWNTGRQLPCKGCTKFYSTKYLLGPDEIVNGFKFPLLNKNEGHCKAAAVVNSSHSTEVPAHRPETNQIAVSIILGIFNTQYEIVKIS